MLKYKLYEYYYKKDKKYYYNSITTRHYLKLKYNKKTTRVLLQHVYILHKGTIDSLLTLV